MIAIPLPKDFEIPRVLQKSKGKSSVKSEIGRLNISSFFLIVLFHSRESLGSVFQQQENSPSSEKNHSKTSEIPPKKRFKNEQNETLHASENGQDMALNFAARVITARAQWIQHQMLQQKMTEQSKLSQMLQIAQFQAYLALIKANKTETSDIIDDEESK